MCSYNGITARDEAAKKTWGDVETTYQRRADLIPNLVTTVKAYAAHESETLQAVTDARARVGAIQLDAKSLGDPAAMEKYQEAQASMGSALSRLLAVSENYPDLKANENFRDLQSQLEGTENRITVARERYNGAVQDFNSTIRAIPGNIVNGAFLKLDPKEPFKAAASASEAPKVSF